MNCAQVEYLLQRRLDGDAVDDIGTARQHLATCSGCRQRWIAATEMGTALLTAAPRNVPAWLTARITGAMRVEYLRRLRVRRLQYAALAASVGIVLLLGYLWMPQTREATPSNRIADLSPSSGNVRFQVEDAATAVAGIVGQTAEKALEPGRLLFPDRSAGRFLRDAAVLVAPLEVPLPTLHETRQSVAEFGPVASLGRFVSYFVDDLPGMDHRLGP